MINTGLLFYKKYYDDSDGGFVYDWPKTTDAQKKRLNQFFAGKLDELNHSAATNYPAAATLAAFPKHAGLVSFTMGIRYPGLLFGTGFRHQTATPGEHKLGFGFDHTTGLPLAPGSTVKGILRSAFPQYGQSIKGVTPLFQTEKERGIEAMAGLSVAEAAEKALQYLLHHLPGQSPEALINLMQADAAYRYAHLLEMQVFEGKTPAAIEREKLVFAPLPMYSRDVFLDALPLSLPGQPLFADDAITHHPGVFSEPNPVKLLKIGGGNGLHFQFLLHDAPGGLINKSGKTKIFTAIIESQGFGAKTSTGYGAAATIAYDSKWLHRPLLQTAALPVTYLERAELSQYIPTSAKFVKAQVLAAKVLSMEANGKYKVAVITAKNVESPYSLSTNAMLEPGKYIKVTAKGVTKDKLISVTYDG